MGEDWLEVTDGPAAGERLDVDPELTVGRAQSGASGLAGDHRLSRTHARFWRAAGGQLIVEDLGSVNGTFVAGRRIDRPAVLAVGDTVALGGTTLVVRAKQPAAAEGPPPTQPTMAGRPSPPQSTRVRAARTIGPDAEAPASDLPPTHLQPPAAQEPPRKRPSRLPWVLVALLVVAVAALAVALATRSTSKSAAAVSDSTVVEPLFPVTNLKFTGQVATYKSSVAQSDVSATVDWGDGTAPTEGTIGSPTAAGDGRYTRSVTATHTYTRIATYAVTVTIAAGAAAAACGSNLAVVTNCFCVTKLPTFARSVDLGPVSGQVFFKPPGAPAPLLLTAPLAVPVGSQLDATRGTMVVMAATPVAGKFAAGVFDGGLFQIGQPQNLGGLIDLTLQPASAAGCGAGNASQVLGLLQARVNGNFRTVGRFSAATVRGTEWTTTEQCDGTLTRVQQGVVQVQDFHTGKTVAVSAGQTLLASK